MSRYYSKQSGLTLFEAMLVLAISAAVIVIGLNQYSAMKRDSEFSVIAANVTILFQSLAAYHEANCISNVDYFGNPLTTGTLDPAENPPDPFPVNINSGATSLVTLGFIKKWPLRASALIDTSAADFGYVLQYNLISNAARPITSMFGTPIDAGINYTWQSQVSIKMRSAANIAAYQKTTGADCTSSLNGATVWPCSANRPGNYLVWTKLPSLTQSASTSSLLWVSLPQTVQFKRLYTNDPMYEINDPNWAASHYYLCGG